MEILLTFAKTENIIQIVAKTATKKKGGYNMPNVTIQIAKYIKEKGIRVSTIAKQTGLPKDALYSSISGNRKLRADEFILICNFLNMQPETFYKQNEQSDKVS